MSSQQPPPILELSRTRLAAIARQEGLLDVDVSVLAKPLTTEEAIGTPGRRDFPIIIGKERILEATFVKARGHAFTDAAREFRGTLAEVLELSLSSNQNRAIFVATLNAVLAHLGRVSATVHCKDDDPEQCGAEIAQTIREQHGGEVIVGLIGLNPAIADHLVRAFGAERVCISDLYHGNVGQERFGVTVWDGSRRTADLVERADVVLMTGTTLQNGSFDAIWAAIEARGKTGLVYGVTAAGVCALTGIQRICPRGRQG